MLNYRTENRAQVRALGQLRQLALLWRLYGRRSLNTLGLDCCTETRFAFVLLVSERRKLGLFDVRRLALVEQDADRRPHFTLTYLDFLTFEHCKKTPFPTPFL